MIIIHVQCRLGLVSPSSNYISCLLINYTETHMPIESFITVLVMSYYSRFLIFNIFNISFCESQNINDINDSPKINET